MKYNKVYFLHIPKTGGRFLTKYILRPMEKTLSENNIELVKAPEDMRQHAGWPSWIDDKTYIITIFRDPCEFFVSTVCHFVAGQKKIIDENKWHIIKENENNFFVEKDELYGALDRWKYIKDFQSQNFILSPDVEVRSLLHESMHEYNNKKVFDKKEIYKRINRVNLMIRNKDLSLMNYQALVNKISEDLEISIDLDFLDIDKEYFKNNASQTLFNSLSEEDKNVINKNFMFDKEIYDNDSLFWIPN